VEQLKAVWLTCDAQASQALIGPADAAVCSITHEQLLRQAFGGDFNRLLAWWRSQRAANSAQPDAATLRQR
jgi:hypothetical protein